MREPTSYTRLMQSLDESLRTLIENVYDTKTVNGNIKYTWDTTVMDIIDRLSSVREKLAK